MPSPFDLDLERHRSDVVVLCYRFLGRLEDAEDAAQETLLRAWRSRDGFRGDASIRTWLHRIATRVCLDTLASRGRDARRRLPDAVAAPADPTAPVAPPLERVPWVGPLPDAILADSETDPAARYDHRESVRLAFVAALQGLPPRQRAVLILRDVLAWRTAEVAALLGATPGAVESALHRARDTMARRYHAEPRRPLGPPDDPVLAALLERYVRAWETADVGLLVATLRTDASLVMPPSPTWFLGRAAIGAFVGDTLFAPGPGHWSLIATSANGAPAAALYAPRPGGGLGFEGLHLLDPAPDAAILAIQVFMDPAIAEPFGLPSRRPGR